MNELDQQLHQAIHQHMMDTNPDQIFSHRVNVFDEVEQKLAIRVNGTVLDIGCGSGYASIWLAKNRDVTKVYAQEASEQAVKQLLPRNINHHRVGEKVEPIAGSFDAIPFENSLDFVVSFGALHHSTCLYSTMSSIANALKDGGYLISQEPVMPNTTSNQDYIDKYNILENRFGMQIRNGDRNDNFFREAEYITAAAFSGLDLMLYEPYTPKKPLWSRIRVYLSKAGVKKQLKILLSYAGLIRSAPVSQPKYLSEVKPMVLVFRKQTNEYIPHVWQGLVKNQDRK